MARAQDSLGKPLTFEEKGEPKREIELTSSAYQPNALELSLAGKTSEIFF